MNRAVWSCLGPIWERTGVDLTFGLPSGPVRACASAFPRNLERLSHGAQRVSSMAELRRIINWLHPRFELVADMIGDKVI